MNNARSGDLTKCDVKIFADGQAVCTQLDPEADREMLTMIAIGGMKFCPYFGLDNGSVVCEGMCKLKDYEVEKSVRNIGRDLYFRGRKIEGLN